LWELAALLAVENDPHSRVLGKVLEMVLGSSSHEQQVACLECVSLAVVNEDASPTDDDIEFILCVRRLLVRSYRQGELHVEGAALQ
jgi:hypothetical protein